jgi:hypothetical protein
MDGWVRASARRQLSDGVQAVKPSTVVEGD